MGETSIEGIEEVRANEIYPKNSICLEDTSLIVPYPPLPGEAPHYVGTTSDGILVLSNYRLYLSSASVYNIPLGLIEQVEIRDIFHLCIQCKDGRSFRCTLKDNDKCQMWFKRIQKATAPLPKLDNHFGFVFYLWSRDEHRDDFYAQLQRNFESDIPEIYSEASRMKFNLKNVWKVANINVSFELCPSYPRHIIVPASITDELLELIAKFRYSRRIPAVVWRHQQNGCVIARCSQPEVGWLGWRSKEDEIIVQAIADACMTDPGPDTKDCMPECHSLNNNQEGDFSIPTEDRNGEVNRKRQLLILDARSYTAAVANRAKGGGCECREYYPNCEIQFLGLANIHSIRKSFTSIRSLCCSTADQNSTWLSSLENSKWLLHISGLIEAANVVVTAVDVDKRPVLVHCSDGWDRTPQIVALAELCMDPYYRTRKGFQVLVEREWLEFGHKFADRCGHSLGTDDLNERSPVFLQWLDCVHQLIEQFECYFEFNLQFLVKLAHHTYSCLFGTFLCNTDQERKANRIQDRTFSIWPFLNENTHFHNFLFNNSSEVLRPSHEIKDLKFWSAVYAPTNVPLGKPTMPTCEESMSVGRSAESTSLVKARSCDNLSCVDHLSRCQRRNSDSNLVDSVCFSEDTSKRKPVTSPAVALPVANSTDTEHTVNAQMNGDIVTYKTIGNRTGLNEGEPRPHSNLMCREPTIDGSTDTLVSENGVILSTSSEDPLKPANSQQISNLKRSSSVSTSTSDLFQTGDGGGNETFMPMSDCANIKWPLCHAIWDAYIAKKNIYSASSCNRSYATPHHSRTPSSGFPATPCDDATDDTTARVKLPHQPLDVDGLVITKNEVQEQLQKLIRYYKKKVKNLENDLSAARNEAFYQICRNCQAINGLNMDADDAGSNADSTCSGEHRTESSAASDISWEQVDSIHPILWVPDHAVSYCPGCESKFWAVKRKHHCRKCGQVFCSNCTSQMMPVPSEQLFHPVRVCNFCFEELQLEWSQSLAACDKLPKAAITAASN